MATAPRFGWMVIALVLLALGCKDPDSGHSAIFQSIFGETHTQPRDSVVFRNVYFGESVEEVAKHEQGDPKYNDAFGLSYDLPSVAGEVVQVQYYQVPSDKAGVASILLEVELPDEYVAVSLYREIEEYLNLRYGPPRGLQGNYSWESEDWNTMAFLHLTESKRRIILNFLPLNGLKPPIEMTDSIPNQNVNP